MPRNAIWVCIGHVKRGMRQYILLHLHIESSEHGVQAVLVAATDKVPGVFTFLGIRNETLGSVHGLHTPRFTMDEAQMPLVRIIFGTH